MKLSFCARGDQLVSLPGEHRIVDQMPRYVGRVAKILNVGDKKAAAFPAAPDPFCCDSDSDTGRRLTKLCTRDGSLWPADRETAEHCGVDFVPVEHRDGEWIPKAPKSVAKPPKD